MCKQISRNHTAAIDAPRSPLEASPRTRHSTWVFLSTWGQDPNWSDLWVLEYQWSQPIKLDYSTNWVNWVTSFRVKMHKISKWRVLMRWMMLNVQTFDNYLYGYTWRLEAHQKTCPVAAVWLPHAACTRSTAPEIKPHLNMNENLRLAVIDPQILTTFPSSPAWANKS